MAIYDESLDGNMDIEAPQIYIMKRSGERVIFDGEKMQTRFVRRIRKKVFSRIN